MRVTFSPRELDIMAVLWEYGPATVAEIRERLASNGVALAHNTVLTVVRILETKGRVGRRAQGRTHRYYARVKREDAGTSAIARIVETVFGGSAERLMTHLAHDPALTRDDIRRVRSILDARLAKEADE